jgi:hypothetical protein
MRRVFWYRCPDTSIRTRIVLDECLKYLPVVPRDPIYRNGEVYYPLPLPGLTYADSLNARAYYLSRDERWVRHRPHKGGLMEVTREEVIRDLEENGIPIPAELREPRDGKPENRPRSDEPTLSEDERVPATAEYLLAALEALSPDWHTAEEIARRASLKTPASKVREILGWLKRLKYVESGMKGYKRTSKVYPHQLPPV